MTENSQKLNDSVVQSAQNGAEMREAPLHLTATLPHTPGPWKVTSVMLGHAGDVYAPTAEKITDCHHVARCFAPKPTKAPVCDLQLLGATHDAISVIQANARLIAAAPELLEIAQEANNALNAMAAQVDAEWRDHDKAAARHDAIVRAFRAKVRAAISKATQP